MTISIEFFLVKTLELESHNQKNLNNNDFIPYRAHSQTCTAASKLRTSSAWTRACAPCTQCQPSRTCSTPSRSRAALSSRTRRSGAVSSKPRPPNPNDCRLTRASWRAARGRRDDPVRTSAGERSRPTGQPGSSWRRRVWRPVLRTT